MMNSHARMELAFHLIIVATVAMTAKMDLTNRNVRQHADQENSSAVPVNVSAKAESATNTLTAGMEVMKTIAVSWNQNLLLISSRPLSSMLSMEVYVAHYCSLYTNLWFNQLQINTKHTATDPRPVGNGHSHGRDPPSGSNNRDEEEGRRAAERRRAEEERLREAARIRERDRIAAEQERLAAERERLAEIERRRAEEALRGQVGRRPVEGRGGSAQACTRNEWQCTSGQCVSLNSRCDGRGDCSDFSDEYQCRKFMIFAHFLHNFGFSFVSVNPLNFRWCHHSFTLSLFHKIIKIPFKRTNKREEAGGRSCDRNMFRCENGPCIQGALRCNGRVDCPFDTSDELDCCKSHDCHFWMAKT